MKRAFHKFKSEVQKLRKGGNTYSQINTLLNTQIPKSTLSDWCRELQLSHESLQNLSFVQFDNVRKGSVSARKVLAAKRGIYLKTLERNNLHLKGLIRNKDVGKISLALLYWAEGRKRSGALQFGNSDPSMISLFLFLLRKCYQVDELKLRCTVQARADQSMEVLENFWSNVTHIPASQFYKGRVDRRTQGKPSKRLDYKGVCVLNYFSANVFNELAAIVKILVN